MHVFIRKKYSIRLYSIKAVFVSMVLVILMLMSGLCFAEDTSFRDVRGHWAESYVSALVEKGSVSGMPDGLFYPDDNITFPQFVTIIISGEYGAQMPVNEHWASGYMQMALEKGLIDAGDLKKTEDITRFEAVRLVSNALSYIFEEEEVIDIMSVPDFLDFADCRICQDNYSYARQCHVKGIVVGRPSPDGNFFDGDNNLSRAEGCAILMRMLAPELRTPPL